MSRSLKKGPYLDLRLMEKVEKALKIGDKKPIKTWARASTITPIMVGLKFQIHNGKDFPEVLIDENMVGHKLGEFSMTRKFVSHGGKMAKEEVKAAAPAKSATPAVPPKK